ncbi:MAG: lytic transglycosylase domain-containing protein [Verrucomicrobia bacterium]|nr:lytic transglycosylase domain-containing protein [Verrucomicrobiota bacterium]
MKRLCLLLLALATAPLAVAQDKSISLDDLLQDGAQWIQDNLDLDALRSLTGVDQQKAEKLFQDLQQQLQGEYVVDLAKLKTTAEAVLPLLESNPDSRPYAAWLKTRLDYLDVAEEFRLTIPPPEVKPGQPPKPVPNPAPELQRKVWEKRLETRPAPKASDPLVSRLKPIFAAQRVPAELAWLAEVESSFDPGARSPAGAAGLYQLMPATAKSLGLSLRPRDERLQPEKNALAAAKYLKYLHGRFKDWPLALAAYNVGEGRISGLLEKHQARTFDQIATRLPAETQMYVPKVEATLRRREGVSLAKLPAPSG